MRTNVYVIYSRKITAFFRYKPAVRFLAILLISVVLALSLLAFFPTSVQAASKTTATLLDPVAAGSPEVDGKAYVLYDAQSGTFLTGKNEKEPLPPASITKVMTVLLALENLKLTDTITITRDMFETIPNDYTRLGLVEGEIITVEQALLASLLISANDTAMALALTMGGSIDGFTDMMNNRARELGCTDTHFTNPYGYADEDHLTTACDMALITAQALTHPVFTQITTKKNHLLPPTNLYEESRGLPNGNRFIATTQYAYDAYIGGKTGYTKLSRYTIVAGAEKDGRTLVGVILGASNSPIRYSNLIDLFEYGFGKYVTSTVDLNEYEAIKLQAIDQIKALINDEDYPLYIDETELQLDAWTTTTNTRDAGGYTASMDFDPSVLKADLASQVLNYPLYRHYADGSKVQVGVLVMTVLKQQPTPTASGSSIGPSIGPSDDPTADTNAEGPSIIRYILVGILSVILAFAVLLLVAMLKRDMKRRRRGKPRML
ncbi:MAG: D-alanyl-D-alanine carboxypeptidase family protein [Bacillota bacterium]|nr:D-alanyl-D-alanine carboxypeptidase family protein [Bacillota bacterium]